VAAADGRVLGRVRVTGAANVDWEAIARGPCGPPPPGGPPPGDSSRRTPAGECLWIGDVGDNPAAGYGPGAPRADVTLYRVPEPLGALAGPPAPRRARAAVGLPAATAPAAALRVRYADGPHDVEAMAVLPDGDAWLITKHPSRRADGSRRPALVYRVDAAAWGGRGRRRRGSSTACRSFPGRR
jgi:hypothetical protein